MDILKADKQSLEKRLDELKKQYEHFKSLDLKLDMSRGKPCREQLALSEGLLTVISHNDDAVYEGTDSRNYSLPLGLPACRKLFAEMLDVPVSNVVAGGNSSLTMMFDAMSQLVYMGAAGVLEPWHGRKIKFLCPVPGYDRHFDICEYFDIEMIPIEMDENGPKMDIVEQLAGSDPSVKGMFCVPKYSNPGGQTYSDETIDRLSKMKTAAPDFRIFWDNAYNVHYLTGGAPRKIVNIYERCVLYGNEDRPLIFTSTSKITMPGAGVGAFAGSDRNFDWYFKRLNVQSICADKVNQLRHVLFFKNADGVLAHMAKHAEIIAPKFDMVENILEEKLGGCGFASWSKPEGGYFISFDGYPGCAKKTNLMCKEAGVAFTAAGSTFPYKKDPLDRNQRIAPTMPPVSDLKTAIEVFAVCAELCAVEKRIEELS